MSNSVRKNTAKLIFGPGTKVPSYLDVLKFSIDTLKLSAADIHSIYKDENGGQFYIKLIDEETFSAFIADSDECYQFKFEDGSTAKVQVEQASRIFRYVRIFNLPPEIEDATIQYVLGQYGTIRQHVRERFPNELKVNIFTGVRGVHMEVSKEIPAHLYIGHFRARIFYDGLKNKCFFCKAEGHVKQNCPKMAAIASGSGRSNQASGSASLGRPANPVLDLEDPIVPKMTTLKKISETPISITTTPTPVTPSVSITTSTTAPSVSTNTTASTSSISTTTSAVVPSVSTDTTAAAPSVSTTTSAAESSASTTTTSSTPTVTTSSIITTTKQTESTNTSNVEDGPQPIVTDAMEAEISELDRQTLLKRTKSSSPDSSEEDTAERGKNEGKGRAAPVGGGNGFVPVRRGKGKGKKKKTK